MGASNVNTINKQEKIKEILDNTVKNIKKKETILVTRKFAGQEIK